MKMKIEDFVERWNDERPEGFISMSEKQLSLIHISEPTRPY